MAAKEKKFTFIKIQHVKLQCKKNLLQILYGAEIYSGY